MALSSTERQQIYHALQAEGFRIQFARADFESVKNVVIKEGELCDIPSESYVKIGNGNDKIENLPSVSYLSVAILPEDNAAIIASKIWNRLKKMALSSIVPLVAPEEVIAELELQKPLGFSLLLGEALDSKSPFKKFWNTAPNAQGLFFCNDSHNDTTNDPNISIKLGEIETSQLKRHKHSMKANTVQAGGEQVTVMIPMLDAKDKPIIAEYPLEPHYQCQYPHNARISVETRSKNLRVLEVWRTG